MFALWTRRDVTEHVPRTTAKAEWPSTMIQRDPSHFVFKMQTMVRYGSLTTALQWQIELNETQPPVVQPNMRPPLIFSRDGNKFKTFFKTVYWFGSSITILPKNMQFKCTALFRRLEAQKISRTKWYCHLILSARILVPWQWSGLMLFKSFVYDFTHFLCSS